MDLPPLPKIDVIEAFTSEPWCSKCGETKPKHKYQPWVRPKLDLDKLPEIPTPEHIELVCWKCDHKWKMWPR